MTEIAAHRAGERSRLVTLAALVAALLAASAWISIPVGAVPVTFQVFVVILAALLLTPAAAFGALAVYLVLGAAGVPVFSGGQGGLGVLFGPTGGYLVGFLLAASIGSAARVLIVRRTGSGPHHPAADALAAAIAILIVYLFGWFQLGVVTGMSGAEAFAAGVVPFVPVDVVKAGVAIAVASAVRRAGLAAS